MTDEALASKPRLWVQDEMGNIFEDRTGEFIEHKDPEVVLAALYNSIRTGQGPIITFRPVPNGRPEDAQWLQLKGLQDMLGTNLRGLMDESELDELKELKSNCEVTSANVRLTNVGYGFPPKKDPEYNNPLIGLDVLNGYTPQQK